MDLVVILITLFVTLLLVAIGYNNVQGLIHAPSNSSAVLIHGGLLAFFLVILLGSWMYAPQSYEVDNSKIIIKRPVSDRRIELREIKEIRLVQKGEMRGLVRTFGVGGLFGIYGKFYSTGLGNLTFYATQQKNRVLITTIDDKKLVITPNDTSMVEDVKKRIRSI